MILGAWVSKAEGDKAWKMLLLITESQLGLPLALTCLLHSRCQVLPLSRGNLLLVLKVNSLHKAGALIVL